MPPNNTVRQRMAAEISQQLGRMLLSYSGPEPDRVRTAIATLAKDDPQKMEHYLERARQDYRDVLWWADIQEEEDRKKEALRAMTVNERLFTLELFPAWDAAIGRKDRASAAAILQKCELSDFDIEKILDAKLRA